MAFDEETKLNFDENFEWNVENEIKLFESIIGHKPVGINKHFHMACISERFETLMGKPISSDVIWKQLGTMFDLAALDKKESLPFPNEPEEFSLPESEFSDLINEKLALKNESLAESKENLKDMKTSARGYKDSTPAKEPVNKKERKSDAEETGSNNEGEKREIGESESETRKGRTNKEEKPGKRRGVRGAKEKKSEEETPQISAPMTKTEDETLALSSGNKKEKQGVGKRSLRSRTDDSLSNKSLTPPPLKRPRRI